jgi:hypothetical protein
VAVGAGVGDLDGVLVGVAVPVTVVLVEIGEAVAMSAV